MNLKKILINVLLIVASIAVGVVGTVYVQHSSWVEAFAKAAKEAKGHTSGPMVSIGEFTVNLKGDSFLKTSITLEAADEKAEEVIKSKEPIIKDKVLATLANKAISDIETPDKREELRKELLEKINKVSDNTINNVLFVSFVYQ